MNFEGSYYSYITNNRVVFVHLIALYSITLFTVNIVNTLIITKGNC